MLNLFNLFAIQVSEPMSGQTRKIVNMLEVLSSLILLASFRGSNELDASCNVEQVEHKINLLLLLFDLRNEGTMNISEIIIMLRTSVLALAKLFPST